MHQLMAGNTLANEMDGSALSGGANFANYDPRPLNASLECHNDIHCAIHCATSASKMLKY